MLTLRRTPKNKGGINHAAIDIFYHHEQVTLVLDYISAGVSVWSVFSTDWASEKYFPKKIALTNNQPIIINNWLKIYGAKVTETGEAVIHISALRDVKIERRDRVNHND